MAVIWTVCALAAAYALYGAVAGSAFLRRFPALQDGPVGGDGLLRPQEHSDPDEPEMAKRIADAVAADSLRLTKHAARDNPMFHEPHGGNITGLLRGRLEIDAPDVLPATARVGLFSSSGNYPVVARIGFARDKTLGFAINRMAVKIKTPDPVPNVYSKDGTAHELDLLAAEGDPTPNSPAKAFFIRDARQLDMALRLIPPSLRALGVLVHWRNLGMLAGVQRRVKSLMRAAVAQGAETTGWAGKHYYSAGPFALGDGAMKFAWRAQQGHPMARVDLIKGKPVPAHAQAMADWLAAGEPARFDLCVQLATPEAIPTPGPNDPPKSVMAAEYCDLVWDEGAAPYQRIGTLTLEADAGFAEKNRALQIQFNAWNTLPEMRPLGQLFRMRKYAHKAHSETRVAHLFGETPGALVGKCPFSGDDKAA